MCNINTYQHTMCFFWSDHNNEEEVHQSVLSADDAWRCLGQRFKIRHGLVNLTKSNSSGTLTVDESIFSVSNVG